MELQKKTVLIVGRSKLPQGVVVKNVYDYFAVPAVVDLKYGVIVKVETTFVTGITNEFIVDLLLGCSLYDTEEIEDRINSTFYGSVKNPLIAAIKDLHRKFLELQKQNED